MWTNETLVLSNWVSDGGLGSDSFGEYLWGESTSNEVWILEVVNSIIWS